MGSRIIAGSHLDNRTLRRLVRLFALEVPARRAAKDIGVHHHTAERIYQRIRLALVATCEREALLSRGVHEVDESYFGGYRKGKRGRGAAGKVTVFGILKRNGRVHTTPVPDVTKTTLRAIIREKIPAGSTIYSDSLHSYDGLITDGYRHYRINHGKTFAATKRRHINGIENFWAFAKTRLRRYYGTRRSHFPLYLKEMEFRFNHRMDNLPLLIERIVKSRRANLY